MDCSACFTKEELEPGKRRGHLKVTQEVIGQAGTCIPNLHMLPSGSCLYTAAKEENSYRKAAKGQQAGLASFSEKRVSPPEATLIFQHGTS